MASTRQSKRTASRTSSLSRDPEADRAAAGARRRQSLFDDENSTFGSSTPLEKFNYGNSGYDHAKSAELSDRIRKFTRGFDSGRSWNPNNDSQKTEVSWKTETNSRGMPFIQKQEVTFASPDSGNTYRRSSINDLTSLNAKPFESSLRTRRSSFGNGGEDFGQSYSSTRVRKYSEESGSSALPPRPSRTFSIEEPKFQTAKAMRDARKLQSSEEMTENINRMVSKMKRHHVDDSNGDVMSFSRSYRATSVDPFEDDSSSRSRSRQRKRFGGY